MKTLFNARAVKQVFQLMLGLRRRAAEIREITTIHHHRDRIFMELRHFLFGLQFGSGSAEDCFCRNAQGGGIVINAKGCRASAQHVN